MRILVITNLYPNPYQPNRATFNRQQFEALTAKHAVAIISPIAWTDELRQRWRGPRRLPAGRRLRSKEGILIEHPMYLYPPKILRRAYGRCFRLAVKPAFERMVRLFRPDIVLGTWAYPDGWAATDLGHAIGLPVVIKVHGSDILTLKDSDARRQGTVQALQRADGVIAVSNHLAQAVVALGVDERRVIIVHNGVDAQLFSKGSKALARQFLGLQADARILLYVGNLVWIKGVDVLIEACAKLESAGVRVQCYLIGGGSMRPTLERLIQMRGLGRQVRLLGSVPHDRLPDWYRAADLLVVPSRSEGIPNVLLEAAACGTPWVASRVGGIPEIAGLGDGALALPEDAVCLAGVIRAHIQDRRVPPAIAEFRSHSRSANDLAKGLGEVMSVWRSQRALPRFAQADQ